MYLHDWGSRDWEGFDGEEALLNDFEIKKEDLKGCIVVLASYSYANYSGDAFVLLKDPADGKLYEVNGGHCSCHGLEGQWNLEPTTLAALWDRLDNGSLGTNDYCENEFADHLRSVLYALGPKT